MKSSRTTQRTPLMWWKTLDTFDLGSRFRIGLDRLAKMPTSPHSTTTEALSFLTDQGIAQMAMNLLPLFRHLIIKCGERGVMTAMRVSRLTKQAPEGSDIHGGRIVSSGSGGGHVVVLRHFPAKHFSPESIVNVTEAGDTLVASILGSLVRDSRAQTY